GPGSAEGDKIELLAPSCIFSQKGQKSDGSYQQTGGIVIRTNMAGKWGEMRIQVNLWLGPPMVRICFHYNPAPGNQHFSGTPVVPMSLASVIHVVYFDGKKAWSPWYGIDGFASSKQMDLLAIPELHEDSDVPLQVWNVFRIEKVKGGWQFHITFTAAGEEPFTRKIFFFTQNIVDGVLHDRL
ncbi:hypothetical protein FOZ62_023077, partial [Perkinsus olseni]